MLVATAFAGAMPESINTGTVISELPPVTEATTEATKPSSAKAMSDILRKKLSHACFRKVHDDLARGCLL